MYPESSVRSAKGSALQMIHIQIEKANWSCAHCGSYYSDGLENRLNGSMQLIDQYFSPSQLEAIGINNKDFCFGAIKCGHCNRLKPAKADDFGWYFYIVSG